MYSEKKTVDQTYLSSKSVDANHHALALVSKQLSFCRRFYEWRWPREIFVQIKSNTSTILESVYGLLFPLNICRFIRDWHSGCARKLIYDRLLLKESISRVNFRTTQKSGHFLWFFYMACRKTSGIISCNRFLTISVTRESIHPILSFSAIDY